MTNAELPPVSDHQITEAMNDCGGGFVKYSDIAEKMRCPACGKSNIIRRHHDGTAAVPECDFRECEDCGNQFDHN